jgi:hypothetical protein
MIGFIRYCLPALTAIALAGVTLVVPANVTAQAKQAPAKGGQHNEQLKHPSTKKTELREESGKTFLHKDWQVQSSCDDKTGGDKISTPGFEAGGWHRADVPATVVGVLVTDKTYADPNYGTNLKNFPGMYISDKVFFANVDMPTGSPFACSWWFRAEFKAPADGAEKTAWLHFNGIN